MGDLNIPGYDWEYDHIVITPVGLHLTPAINLVCLSLTNIANSLNLTEIVDTLILVGTFYFRITVSEMQDYLRQE